MMNENISKRYCKNKNKDLKKKKKGNDAPPQFIYCIQEANQNHHIHILHTIVPEKVNNDQPLSEIHGILQLTDCF